MARYNTILNSFQYGEISPRFLARTDTEQFLKGAKKIENMIVLPSGGIVRRPGSVKVANTRVGFHNIRARMIPFQFSKTESYMLVLIATIDASNRNYLELYVYRPDGQYSAEPINLNEIAGGNGTFSGIQGYTSSLEFRDPWSQDDLDVLQFKQIGDLVFCAHQSHEPFYLVRTAADTFEIRWTLDFRFDDFEFTNNRLHTLKGRPYRDENTGPITLTPSATTGTITLTASADFFDVAMAYSVPDAVGIHATYFRISDGTTEGVVRISGVTSPTVATAVVLITLPGTSAYDQWTESAWSHSRGFPGTIGSFESRLVYGGTRTEPDTTYASLVGNLFHFMQERLDQDKTTSDVSGINFFGATALVTDAFSFVPVASQINGTCWIEGGRTLAIGTIGQEFVASGSEERILSASTVSFRDQTSVGSSPVQATRVGNRTVFVSRDGKMLYAHSFDNDQASYIADPLNAIAEHIVHQTDLDLIDAGSEYDDTHTNLNEVAFKYICWQGSRECLWGLTSEGKLVGMTWSPGMKCLAWHRHPIGNAEITNDGPSGPRIKTMAILPSEDGKYENLWLWVVRSIGGIYRSTIEIVGCDYKRPVMPDGLEMFYQSEHAIYMDCAHEFSDSNGDTIFTGLDHLEGAELEVLADGCYHPPVTVTSGQITLQRTAYRVIVGFKQVPKLTLCPLDAGSQIGSSQGMMTRVDRMTIRFHQSRGVKIVGPGDTEEVIEFRSNSDVMGAALPLYTGDKPVHVPMDPETRCELTITSDKPFPITILGVVLRGQTHE